MAALALLLALGPWASLAVRTHQGHAANPIRKVVTMLQDMQAKVTEEGKKEQDLYDKFMCYCKTNRGGLESGIEEAKGKIASLTSALKGSTEKKDQLQAELKDHKGSRDDANDAIAKATSLREKEAAGFAAEEADSKANLAALAKAIPAIEQGMAGAFLQTGEASSLRRFAMEKATLPDQTREDLLAFLSGTQGNGYVPQSAEIVGILKQLQDDMSKGLAEAKAAEKSAIASFGDLLSAKKKEVAALSAQIEEKLLRVGNIGVENAEMENDLADTKESLAGDIKFLTELKKGCETKAKEWEEVERLRASELVALADTIKVLNDDDALELFKKTLPSASASFVQVEVSSATLRSQALTALKAGHHSSRPEIDFIALALTGKKVGFEKVLAMVDEMVANLKAEQKGDSEKKAYCIEEFDSAEDKKKQSELSISDSETAIEEMKGAIAGLEEEISSLTAGIKALDKSVAEATAMRKEEHSDHMEIMTNDATAKELLHWASNRLNKFYDPKLYKAPPKEELSEADSIAQSFGGEVPTEALGGIAGTGIGAALVQLSQRQVGVPPPPPETFGPYTKKTEEKNGVMAMINLLIKDLDKEMTTSKVEEAEAQKEYEEMMADAAAKRAEDAKSLSDKAASKASLEEALDAEEDKKEGEAKDLDATMKYIQSLHGECDWLLKYYDARKSARDGEIDSLGKAKDVLNGADFSLVQTGRASKALRGPPA
mmetsp:Transcript_16815/g.39435  ORF Transcript_16815/g.39435 Transcript_16815/m.39435 type:complete len:718 (-) Transcript_16815:126-2279(-)|eukprot:CAMPEP_0171089720 /NCGR_PEP_ID=MMETSP0766_2-20121228/27291_1 /TAXON_ID=439317 /ORGANISM="Gambierdiscus australes, Strain CAWD 149" /LENGTH=717 /DNA_ID=CAMNT_0011547623 /DNA_START=44 /DNA_END=2197 /DNA_ORIENTATION=+